MLLNFLKTINYTIYCIVIKNKTKRLQNVNFSLAFSKVFTKKTITR